MKVKYSVFAYILYPSRCVAFRNPTMKQFIYALMVVSIFGCKNSKEGQTSKVEKIDTLKVLLIEERNIEYPISVQYTGYFEPDTMLLTMNDKKYIVTPKGKVFKKDGTLFFDIRCEYQIEDIYFYSLDGEIIVIYVDTDMDGAGSSAKRINPDKNTIIWETRIYGFNMGRPVIIDKKAYLSTIAFVGKLNLVTGKYDWKFEDLYKNGKYNSFGEPKFFEDDVVLFTSERLSGQVDSILIQDRTGQLLKMN